MIDKESFVVACKVLLGYNREEALAEFETLHFCEVDNCTNLAEWEGWYKVRDFSGNTTGLMQKRCVCEEHKCLLEGFNDND